MRKRLVWLAAGGLTLLMAAAEAKVLLNAAGATLPDPIYEKWFQEFAKKVPDAQINYQPIGSGGGIRQLTEGTVDFGASDMPMTNELISKMKVKPLHFPTVLGAVVPIYNIAGVNQELKFTPAALAGIFLGKIKKWDDPELKNANPGVKFPNAEITVMHRTDGSGTTFVFTDYLSKVSPAWRSTVGNNASVKWPTGVGGKGSDGVSGLVKESPNSIGYVELVYAMQNKIGYGSVQNAAGNFVKADLASVTEAAAGAAKSMPDDFRVSITNAPGKSAYPISTFTWLLIPSRIEDGAKKKIIVEFLGWMLTDGQKYAGELGYAPLPKVVAEKEQKAIARIQ
jgi:phosphate transport system substrate-binding protein